jgi:hypothetical protein
LLLSIILFYREELYLKGSEIFNVFAINLFSFSIFIECVNFLSFPTDCTCFELDILSCKFPVKGKFFMSFSCFRQGHTLRVFENKVLRRIFGPMKKKVAGEWGKLHNKELHYFISLPNIVSD